MLDSALPVGKLPRGLLADLIAWIAGGDGGGDPRVLVRPGIGLDCAVVDAGPNLLVLKSDPITFATEEIGWYLVHVNANDVAAFGATPRWLMVTMLLPESHTTPALAERIARQIHAACREVGATVIGGHTEITGGLGRPILAGTMIGEVSRDRLITPAGARPGQRILLTKGVPIEATAILARDFPDRLRNVLSESELKRAQGFLRDPGISVLRDAQAALRAGAVSAMHDPTEGGLLAALWELSKACSFGMEVDLAAVPVPPLAERVCRVFGLDPLASIASGALLLTAPSSDAAAIRRSLEAEGIPCAEIGCVMDVQPGVWAVTPKGRAPLPWPEQDELARLLGKAE